MIWKNSKNKSFYIEEILSIIRNLPKEHLIAIGTDSQVKKGKVIFVTAICVDAKESYYHRKFFYFKRKLPKEEYKRLYVRLIKETEESIFISNMIKHKINKVNIEIHSDINLNKRYESAVYSNTIKGYILGCGFSFILKPFSYAASSVADKYTKKK